MNRVKTTKSIDESRRVLVYAHTRAPALYLSRALGDRVQTISTVL